MAYIIVITIYTFMKKLIQSILLAAFTAVVLVSCEKEEVFPEPEVGLLSIDTAPHFILVE